MEFLRKSNPTIDLKKLSGDINSSRVKETTLRTELEGLNGIFKKKARDDCQFRLEQQESNTKDLIDRLQKNHGIRPEQISQKLNDYAKEKQNYLKEKTEGMEMTDKVEQLKQQSVNAYKFHKPLSDCQQSDLREISERISARVKLRPGEDRIFRLTQEDRKQLLKDYEGKVDPRTIEKCKNNFEKQDEMERQEKQAKTNPIERTQTKSRGWEMER